jgi:two-component system, OmpR family, sensor kinase
MISREKLSKESLTNFTHSIRFRLVMWFVLILGAIMVVFSAFIFLRQAQDVRNVAMGRLSLTLEHALGSSEGEHASEQPQIALSMITGVNPNLGGEQLPDSIVAIQSAEGSILQSQGLLTSDQLSQASLPSPGWKGVQQVDLPKTLISGNNRFLFVNPAIEQNGAVVGYLLVGVPLDATDQLGRLLVTLVVGNLVTLAIALTGGLWLADQALRPVKTITQTAHEISETDLSKRLHLPGRDELTELGNTFDQMLDRLQAAFERQRQFTADASHELRTPLTIIDLETSRMLSGKRSAEDYERVLKTIKSENKSMIRLVTNLLELARMDAGQLSLKAEAVDLAEMASEVIERIAPLAKAQGVSLDVGELQETNIQGDRTLLTQMLTNLVENAVKYSASVPEPRVEISVGRREEGGRQVAWLRVSDNGIGIEPDNLEHIFDRFYQVDASRTRADGHEGEAAQTESSGTGLGLAIAQWIARAHGGEIHASSTLGQGSTFEVVLPMSNPSE